MTKRRGEGCGGCAVRLFGLGLMGFGVLLWLSMASGAGT